jgi:ketosteroid isomerase-like protein
MSAEENRAIVRHAVEAFNQGDHDAVDELFAANYVDPITTLTVPACRPIRRESSKPGAHFARPSPTSKAA